MKPLADGSILISGRRFSAEQIQAMRKIITENPQLNRSRLALQACEHFQWYNAAGTPRHMSMKIIMLSFHRTGLIELPPPQPLFINPPARRLLLETFVDEQRFRGHCYRAANWMNVGRTTGRGKYDRDHKGLSSIKSIWIYPLAKRALQSLRMDPS